MKNIVIVISLLLVLASCQNTGEVSDAYGNFETTEVIVSSEANGKIIVLNIAEGDIVDEGQEVGLIDTTDFHLKKETLLSNIAVIESKADNLGAQIAVQKQNLENLRVEHRRIKNLYDSGAATQQQFDNIDGRVKVLEAQIQALYIQKKGIANDIDVIYAQVKQLDENIDRAHIRNPQKGQVLTKFAEAGEITAFGKPVYKVANLDLMDLKVYVSGDQLPHIKLGQKAEVLIDKTKTENSSLEGEVSWISSTAEFTPKIIQTKEERVNLVYAVKVKVKNDGSLKIGMPGEVNFK